MPNYIEKIERVNLPVIPLRGIVVFPRNSISMELTGDTALAGLDCAGTGGLAFFVLQKDYVTQDPAPDALESFGTVAKIKQTIKMSDKVRRVIIEGVDRASTISVSRKNSLMRAELLVKKAVADEGIGVREEAYIREAVEVFTNLTRYMPKLNSEVVSAVKGVNDIGLLADFIACHVLVRIADKQNVLEAVDPVKRIRAVISAMYEEEQLLSTEADIHRKVQEQIDRNQRDYFLREQLKVIRTELGDDGADEISEYLDLIDQADLPDEIREKMLKEVARMEKTPFGSAESAVSRNWLDVCLEVPWKKLSKDRSDIARAKKILD